MGQEPVECKEGDFRAGSWKGLSQNRQFFLIMDALIFRIPD